MDFKEKILYYEFDDKDSLYTAKEGKTKVLLTAVHTYTQDNKTKYKKSELFTGAIAKYVSEITNCYYYIKQMDNGIDSNSNKDDIFKAELISIIKENDIKLVIDIHGAKKQHDFDIEIGTLDNKTIEKSILKKLEVEFNKLGIDNIKYNNPFKGGGITKCVHSNTDIDVFQMEINGKYRSNNNIDNVEKICKSLINFIKNNYIDQ